MKHSANSSHPSLLSESGSIPESASLPKSKPRRAPRFKPRPILPAPADSHFARLSKTVAEMVDLNQNAKQRAEAKRATKEDKGKQRATEPPPKAPRRAISRTRSEEIVDQISADGAGSWDMDLSGSSLIVVDDAKRVERNMKRHSGQATTSLAKPLTSPSLRLDPTRPPPQSESTRTRLTPVGDMRRSVSTPQESLKDRSPAVDSPLNRIPHTSHSRDPSPAKVVPAPKLPQPSQPRVPPVLGMRRTNTHSGVSTAFRPSQEIPMKQRGFKTPFVRPQPTQNASPSTSSACSSYDRGGYVDAVPPNSFPVSRRSPSPDVVRGRPPQARPGRSPASSPEHDVVPEADSSYGEISFDEDTLNEIMSQYD